MTSTSESQTSPAASGSGGHPSQRLQQTLGLRGAVALGVGGTVGGGIFVLVGVAAEAAGPGALLAFALGFVVVALIALPYTELTGRRVGSGGGYAFTQHVLGRRWGFVMGWGYLGAWLLAAGYVYAGFGTYAEALVGVPAALAAVGLVMGCVLLNVLGLQPSAVFQASVLAVAVVGLVGFVAWGSAHVELGRLTPFMPEGIQGVLFAAVLAFLSLNGFDAIAAVAEEIRDPERTIPRAVFITLVSVGALYAAVALVALGTLPLQALTSSEAPLATAAAAFGGRRAELAVAATAVCATAATGNAMVVVSSRIAFAMARDGHLPAGLARTTAAGAPRTAVLVCGGVLAGVALLALSGHVALIAGAGGLLYVLHYVPPLVGLMVDRRRAPGPLPSFTTPRPRLLIPAALLAAAVVAAASGSSALALGGAWMTFGLFVLALRRFHGQRRGRRLATASG